MPASDAPVTLPGRDVLSSKWLAHARIRGLMCRWWACAPSRRSHNPAPGVLRSRSRENASARYRYAHQGSRCSLNSLLQAFKFRDKKPSTSRLRTAVIGAGRMGQFHLKHLSKHSAEILSGIVDTSAARRDSLAKTYNTTAFLDPSALIGQIDAAIIATPTSTHRSIGGPLLSAGISCLIEKPLASTLEDAEALIGAANSLRRHTPSWPYRTLQSGRHGSRSPYQSPSIY